MKKPIVMLGECSGKMLVKLQELKWGRMFVRMFPSPYLDEAWGWDNGAFALHTTQGQPRRVSQRELDEWEASLLSKITAVMEKVPEFPMVAVCPDLPFDGRNSLAYSIQWIGVLALLPRRWPWYLAVQDGMDPKSVTNVLKTHTEFEGVFLGGSAHFKYQAGIWAHVARETGKKFHYGRCGTVAKLHHAMSVGADSLDSALPMWTKVGLELFIQTYMNLDHKRTLFDFV